VSPPSPEDASGFRAAWAETQQRWARTLEEARALDEELLHERVNGEWSFVQTLRHLLFVTDSWVGRGVLGRRDPWHRLDVPPTGLTRVKGLADADERAELSAVRRCLGAVIDEVWRHRDHAERDLATIRRR
jgi:hypothetical protein